MGKLIIFFIFLGFVIVYPFLVKESKIVFNTTQEDLPKIEFKRGNFLVYEENLSYKGNFQKLWLSKYDIYYSKEMFVDNLKEKESIYAKFVVFRNNIISGKEVKVKTQDFNLSAKFAKYNSLDRVIDGKEFFLVTSSFKGRGNEFMIDKEKNVYANDIFFILKVK